MPFLMILASVIAISILSLIGVLSLSIGKKRLHEFMIVFVAFASGTMLSASFLHLIPESIHEMGEEAMMFVLAGILLFFFIEKYIHWHHCGKEECHVRPVAYLNLVGDGLHNFIDGVIIAAAYMTSVKVGLVTTFAIALHEIPQEFGDFSILLHSGMETRKALTYNFISASTAVLGALAGFVFLSRIESWIPASISVAAGGFIYIATADLMPELHKHTEPGKMILQSLFLLLGVLMLAAVFLTTGH
ncbi:MAG: ZIP family metal transporter [Candidatus Altiarchaeota archaeon]